MAAVAVPSDYINNFAMEQIQSFFVFLLGLLMKLNLQRKTPAQCMSRVKALERYCTELLSREPRVSQSSDIIHFFIPKEEELHPVFAHNRYPAFYIDVNNSFDVQVMILKNGSYIWNVGKHMLWEETFLLWICSMYLVNAVFLLT